MSFYCSVVIEICLNFSDSFNLGSCKWLYMGFKLYLFAHIFFCKLVYDKVGSPRSSHRYFKDLLQLGKFPVISDFSITYMFLFLINSSKNVKDLKIFWKLWYIMLNYEWFVIPVLSLLTKLNNILHFPVTLESLCKHQHHISPLLLFSYSEVILQHTENIVLKSSLSIRHSAVQSCNPQLRAIGTEQGLRQQGDRSVCKKQGRNKNV